MSDVTARPSPTSRRAGDGFVLTTEDGEDEANYVVLATGANGGLNGSPGREFDGHVVNMDVAIETSVDDAYATRAMDRTEEWQAIVSAGDGAVLDILSTERGEHFQDFDTPDEVRSLFEGKDGD